MGLNVSHGAWDGAYSAFMRWRRKLAEVSGYGDLEVYEGYWDYQRPMVCSKCESWDTNNPR